jgi:hypothetical protein
VENVFSVTQPFAQGCLSVEVCIGIDRITGPKVNKVSRRHKSKSLVLKSQAPAGLLLKGMELMEGYLEERLFSMLVIAGAATALSGQASSSKHKLMCYCPVCTSTCNMVSFKEASMRCHLSALNPGCL